MNKIMTITSTSIPLLFLSACTEVAAPTASHLEASKTAFVKGMDSSMFSLGSTFDIKIESVDGKSTRSTWTGYADGLELPAGTHHLIVFCSMKAEMGNIVTQPGESPIDVDLTAGHVYQLQPKGKTESGGCGAELVDVTGQST